MRLYHFEAVSEQDASDMAKRRARDEGLEVISIDQILDVGQSWDEPAKRVLVVRLHVAEPRGD